MPSVDRNLLRMAVGELPTFKVTPFPILINEALDIGRRFAAPESINFLNGMLDHRQGPDWQIAQSSLQLS
jgi:N utilization substance protein B